MSQQSDSITPWFCEVKPTYCSNICLLCRKEQKHIVLTQQTCNNPNQQQATKVLTISWVHKAWVKHSNPHFLLNSTFTVFLYASFTFLAPFPISLSCPVTLCASLTITLKQFVSTLCLNVLAEKTGGTSAELDSVLWPSSHTGHEHCYLGCFNRCTKTCDDRKGWQTFNWGKMRWGERTTRLKPQMGGNQVHHQ